MLVEDVIVVENGRSEATLERRPRNQQSRATRKRCSVDSVLQPVGVEGS
jgi:hypothetical protein